MKTFPTLYKKTSTGADQFWSISVVDSSIVTKWGQVGGKVQETTDLVKEGKNVGRSNSTTPAEQALSEAESLWEKKLKKGYVKDLKAARAGKTDSIIEGGIFPMLAQRFDEHGDKLKYPCLVQPKFDGHRCIAMIDKDGKCTLWTRSRKPITSMTHIQNELERLTLPPGTILDGELYNHDYRDKFEELTSFIRDTAPKPGSTVVQYHVYDRVDPTVQKYRTEIIRSMLIKTNLPRSEYIVCVPTVEVNDEEGLMLAFHGFLSAGYEGAMARNIDGKYVNKRSYDLLKIKQFMDAEFEVVGVEEGRGKLAGHGIFVCKTADGQTFRAKMMGDTSELKKFWEDPSLAVGRQLTVKFQGMTKKNGVPRFPVALRFRKDV